MSAEGMVAKWAPVIPGYVRNNYKWLRERHCLYDLDDLTQIAMIELMKLSKTWEPRPGVDTRKARNMLFFYDLKWKVAQAIAEHRKRVEPGKQLEDSVDRSHDEYGESTLLPRLSLHQRKDTPEGTVTIGSIVDYFNLLPIGRKIPLALRFWDELSYRQIAELLDRTESTISTDAAKTMATLRDFARNQFTEHAVEVPLIQPYRWQPGETLSSYLLGRHRMDVHEFVGCFALALRADPAILARMLDSSHVVVAGSIAHKIRTDLQQMVDARLAAGMSQAAIARELEISNTTVWNYAHRESANLS